MKRLLSLGLALLALPLVGSDLWAAIINVPGDQPDLPSAVTAANPGDEIIIAAGTQTLTSTLYVNKSLTITGAGMGSTIIHCTGGGGAGNGLDVSTGPVTIQDLDIRGNDATGPRYGLHVSGANYADAPSITLTNVHIHHVYRTGFDLNGVGSASLTGCWASVNGGAGIALTDAHNVTFSNVTTWSNAWGGIGIFTYGRYHAGGTSGITFAGTNAINDTIYLEEGNYTTPASPIPISFSGNPLDGADVTVQVSDLPYYVGGHSNAPEQYHYFFSTLAQAQAFAAAVPFGHFDTRVYIASTATNEIVQGIQAAIDMADPDDVIVVAAGTYTENLIIAKSLTLQGAGSSSTIINGSGGVDGIRLESGGTSAIDRLTIKDLKVTAAPGSGLRAEKAGGLNLNHVTLENLEVTGNGTRGWEIHNNTAATDIEITNCKFNSNGAQGLRSGSNVILDGLVIAQSEFNGNTYGIYLQGTISNVTLQSSSFNNCVGGYGAYMTETGPLTGLAIENCAFNNNDCGMMVWNEQNNSDITVQSSDFQDNNKWGMLIWGNTLSNVLVENCAVLNNDGLVLGYFGIDFSTDADLMTNVAVHDTYTSNGLKNRDDVATARVDASGNYYGVTDPTSVAAKIVGEVDYSPWLGSGTVSTPGFQGDFSELWVDDESPMAGADTRVKEALGLVSGSTINLAPGTFVETAQLVIDEDLTLSGAGSGLSTIAAGFSPPGGSYDTTSSLILVATGVTATIEDLAIDGTGFAVKQAIQSRGDDLTVRDCVVKNISASTYDGRGIVFLTGSGLVENCAMQDIKRIGVHVRGNVEPSAPVVTVDGLSYTGKGLGDWLDYGVEFGGGGSGGVTASSIHNCKGVALSDGSTSAGVLVTDYWGTGTEAMITDSDLSGNSSGVAVGYATTDASVCAIHGCDLSGNADYGVVSVSTVVTTDALGNWWGAADGPSGVGTGSGVPVSDYVLFDPWLTGQYDLTQTASAHHISTIGGTPTQTVLTYALSPALMGVPDWFTYTVFVDYDLNLVPTAVSQIFNPGGANAIFASNFGYNTPGQLQISLSYYGLTADTSYTGDLFSITFSGTDDDPAALVHIASCVLRERPNTNIAVSLDDDESIWVDGTTPGTPLILKALPRHHGVYLTWTPPVPAPAYYRIYRAPRTGYPWCPNLDLPAMAGRTLLTGTIPGGASTWTDVDGAVASVRDVYDYHLVAVDEVEHVSGASNASSATNYFLGDWAGDDGVVHTLDLGQLSLYYGTAVNCPLSGELDVAPTSNMSSFGLPSNHDGLINFEDLIIFAMNFGPGGPVLPLMSGDFVTKDPTQSDADAVAALTLRGDEQGLRLDHEGVLLGYSALLRTERNLVSATLDGGMVLFYRTADGYRVDAAGLGTALEPSQPVRLVFEGQGPLTLVTAEGRDLSNGAVATSVETLGGLDVQPVAFALAQNFPNPFNPTTTIRYALPEAASVKLVLYNALGQEVMTLVNGSREAGYHDVRLDGSSLASGVYIYRIEAGPFSDLKKMVLVK